MTSRRQAKRAIELHADALSEFPNVVGLGSIQVGRDDRPASERDHALAVYVSEKKPFAELDPDALLPGYVEIPGRSATLKVAVKVIELGEVEIEGTENPNDGEHETSTFSAE